MKLQIFLAIASLAIFANCSNLSPEFKQSICKLASNGVKWRWHESKLEQEEYNRGAGERNRECLKKSGFPCEFTLRPPQNLAQGDHCAVLALCNSKAAKKCAKHQTCCYYALESVKTPVRP